MRVLRRRVLLAAVPLLVALALVAADARPAARITGGLTVERHDGSRLRFGPVGRVTCGRFDRGEPRSVRVLFGLRRFRRGTPFWLLQWPARIRRGSFPFPRSNVIGRRGVLFVYDPRPGRAPDNEVSSQEGDSDGRILIHSAGCRPRPHLVFSVYGHLGSELSGLPRLLVFGSVRARSRTPRVPHPRSMSSTR